MKLKVKNTLDGGDEVIITSVVKNDGTEVHLETFNYPDHGSAGMRDSVNALVKMAQVLNIEVVHES